MTNLEVARCFIVNAKTYAKSGDMATVLANLYLIEELLENANATNEEYSWEDFK